MDSSINNHINIEKIDRKPKWMSRIKFSPPSLIVGCGTGTTMDLDKEIYGIDLFDETCLIANKKAPGMIIKADAHSMPFKSSYFNQIVLMHSLEHVFSPYHVLKECLRVLDKNGEISIEVPNSPNFVAERKSHIYGWNKETLANLLKIVGFKEIRVNYVDHLGITDCLGIKNQKIHKILDKISSLIFPNSFRSIQGSGRKL
ncbi:MAG: methyltransferase domain-containing protein [Candidatus Lokiarchaeota archaeon]|nr:methyltransferase domain-containing protein [Candidatus Lokiarchaeota archaeon]